MFNRALLSTRTQLSRAAATRNLHATPVPLKSATEKVSEVADKLNKSFGKGLASAIETGEEATGKTKEVLGAKKDEAADAAGTAKAKAQDTAQTAQTKASETASEASQKKNEFAAEQRSK
ncbi:hypothetical protein FA95DRAFT_1565808 [Auriscalpium vulgare]|uniref:Uncharacterized protein n=1 Tax=Auriscalpium vulgare TaxID=40419 RepID=A0ACB8RAY7_9AGAM|nr:hypothetical protein FA95DRAFT_1565808 [Auriscalpium vulgare]